MSQCHSEECKDAKCISQANRNKGDTNHSTPPSPRRSWMKIGAVRRARSVENMQSMPEHRHPSHRPKSPPLTLTTGSPGAEDGIPMSPSDTPPKKTWESGFKSFLSRRSQLPASAATSFPKVQLKGSTCQQQQSDALQGHKQPLSYLSGEADKRVSNDQSAMGGKIFRTVLDEAEPSQRKNGEKNGRILKSTNELDEPMRNGKGKSFSPEKTGDRCGQSQANVAVPGEDELTHILRRASQAGNNGWAITSPTVMLEQSMHQVHPPQDVPAVHCRHLVPHHHSRPSSSSIEHQQYQSQFGLHQSQGHRAEPHYPQRPHSPGGLLVFNSSRPMAPGPSAHSISPSSATTEIKKAFTEFHNSSLYATDSTSAYLGDEPSTRRGDAHGFMLDTGFVSRNMFCTGSNIRNYSNGSMDSASGHRFLSSSLPPVAEDVCMYKSMRMLRPFQMAESWQPGRRYLIGPAALATCPSLQGISSLSLAAYCHIRSGEEKGSDGHAKSEREESDEALAPLTKFPPLFGSIILGNALLSYVVQEPIQNHQQRWWSSSLLVLRQNYLFEYDQQSTDVLKGIPRGYAHLQYARSYVTPDFADALELEFFVSPCAKADKRVLTIRVQGARQKRDNWIACLNRAAQIDIKDLYDYEESAEVGRGRYATVFPARRRKHVREANVLRQQLREHDNAILAQTQRGAPPNEEHDCALKIIDKSEFWKRVVKGKERADTLVRETSVQATMTQKCAKIPAFVRLRGFFETSDHIVLELELMESMDLFQYVSSKGLLYEKEAACILRDILTVLDGMNRLGVAHRDIKPANCLMCKALDDNSVDKTPCVKVADFGMATFVGVDGLVRGRCGTPGYVAPEIFSAGLHGGYGNKVDIFSAGVILYVMLCGYEPFYGVSDEELVAANREANLDFPSNDWKNVSSEAKDLVKCMMEPDPCQRLSAKEALRHPWIVQHVGQTEGIEVLGHRGVDSMSHLTCQRGEACKIS